MQVYWLYNRYAFSLSAYEADAFESIVMAVDGYNKGRKNRKKSDELSKRHQTEYNIDWDVDSCGRKKTIATVTTRQYVAEEVLGISGQRRLTTEELLQASRKVADDPSLSVTRRDSFDVTSAPSEGDIWVSMKNVENEFVSPLSAVEIDSVLAAGGIDADVSLTVTDSIAWAPSIIRHASVMKPAIALNVPYSELQRKSVRVEYRFPVAEIFGGMAGTLVVVALLSLFLIVCLILQFSTILKLSRLDRMRSSFVATMIHELKRPIATLKMCVSGMGNESMMADAEVRDELLGSTRSALDNLSAYFSRLRDITFNDIEQIPLNITTFDLAPLFDDAVASTAIPSGKSVGFHNNIEPGLKISADRTHLLNILTNLVENAVKYSGSRVDVTAEAAVGVESVKISVSDTGDGIPRSDIDKIFTRFYRGKAAGGEQPGIGLGLTYVRMLVEAHGGSVEVESVEGEGSLFTIILPQ